MSVRKLPFEMSDEFPLIPEHLGTGDFSRASCQNTGIRLPAGLAAWVPECEPISDLNFGYPERALSCRPAGATVIRPCAAAARLSRRASAGGEPDRHQAGRQEHGEDLEQAAASPSPAAAESVDRIDPYFLPRLKHRDGACLGCVTARLQQDCTYLNASLEKAARSLPSRDSSGLQ